MPTLVGTTTTGWSHATLWEMGFARRMAPQAPGIGTLTLQTFSRTPVFVFQVSNTAKLTHIVRYQRTIGGGCEPPRDSRRLQTLRGWSHEHIKTLLPRSPSAGDSSRLISSSPTPS